METGWEYEHRPIYIVENGGLTEIGKEWEVRYNINQDDIKAMIRINKNKKTAKLQVAEDLRDLQKQGRKLDLTEMEQTLSKDR